MNFQTFRERLLFSTILIKSKNHDGDIVNKGTGFLMTTPLKNSPGNSLVLLISNKHVFEASASISINYHTRNPEGNHILGKFITHDIEDFSEEYYIHPNNDIDLACINLSVVFDSMHPQIYGRPINTEILSNFTESFLNIGQRVYYVGYPEGRFDITNNLPITRTGSIASHPSVDFNGKPQFLIDSNVFKGTSGSPVFINVREAGSSDGLEVAGNYDNLLLGVITETMTFQNKVVSAYSVRNQDSQYIEEILGIGLVYKSTVISELINNTLALFET